MKNIFIINNYISLTISVFLVKYLCIPNNSIIFVINRIIPDIKLFPFKALIFKNTEQVESLLGKNEFSLYFPHDRCCNYLVDFLMRNQKLKNCFYIEEGNLSYNDSRYKYSERIFLKKIYNLPFINLFTRQKTFFYANCAYALSKGAFPFLEKDKVVYFDFKEVVELFMSHYNFHSFHNSYLFLISVHDDIKIIKNRIKKLKGKKRYYLKFHPSFNYKKYKSLKQRFISSLSEFRTIIVCDDSFFVELESYYKSLIVYGGYSSSQRYFDYLRIPYNNY